MQCTHSLAIRIYWVARIKLTMTMQIVTCASNGIFSNSFLVLYPQFRNRGLLPRQILAPKMIQLTQVHAKNEKWEGETIEIRVLVEVVYQTWLFLYILPPYLYPPRRVHFRPRAKMHARSLGFSDFRNQK